MADQPNRAPDSDGRPQPASAPMDKEAAQQLEDRTHGQLVAMPGDREGEWLMYQPGEQESPSGRPSTSEPAREDQP